VITYMSLLYDAFLFVFYQCSVVYQLSNQLTSDVETYILIQVFNTSTDLFAVNLFCCCKVVGAVNCDVFGRDASLANS